ncbi:PREDICTED: probably inactive leucine-rich repeat receptor-like protein kinase At3g28040 [Fragaria vesca subsp. vesca]|uniref:probably inactive leucine-rich repeat receptor-like protein kinase At3g28040 n=1 Tax=Fragaria vesca subsp. vesca TaxID=101020 RepID=UPI0002C308A1|nr:PREDICTED: probably inactive leucine-rich repeat receptor-like protein kinase At3g28040 [Fragaria vesca subsp. vesca]XP_011466417.1 PREDICTED: probably inactive leucine-rich repeat receptor-like protein kinase At3g28040 [Fragaria vesca subsp. vesca]
MSLINKLVFLLLLCLPVLVVSLNPVFNDDVLGLIVFKAGLLDPEAKLSSWNEEDDTPCHWVGVKCDVRSNRVSELALDGFGLSGHVNRGLLRLQVIQRLSLSNNNFTGSINPDLAHIGTLQVIDLSQNSLSGSIPDEFFQQCGSLRVVSFAKNKLSGRIPESLSFCSALVAVNFSSNQLSGSLPSGIWYLRGLQELDLSGNLLEGEVHEGIGYLYDLRVVNLGKNRFSGWLPGDVGGCSHLKLLDFSDNLFSGGIPESIKRLGLCRSLSLKGNSLTGQVPAWIGELRSLGMLDLSCNNFSGGIPGSLGNLKLLEKLNLSVNEFTGSLPESLTNCFNLLALDVSRNQLVGKLPSWILKLGVGHGKLEYNPLKPIAASHGGLQVLDLSSNAFSDVLPSDIGVLSSLQFLNVSRNQLLGSIPASIGNLKTAYVLDLSDNRLNGSIPSEIGGAVSLKELRLHKNFLTGKLPSQIEKCSSLSSLLLSQNNLSGPVPVAIANLTNLQYVDLSLNQFSGSLPKELTNLSHLLYFNVSYNHLQGELPVGGFFNTISPSSISGNPSLCGSVLNLSCPAVHPKPIVLNPNSNSTGGGSSSLTHGHKNVFSISALIAIGAAAFIAIGVIAITVLNMHVRSSMTHSAPLPLPGGEDFSCSPSTDSKYGKLVMFSGDADFAAGAQALLNKDCELGRGGFGVVYRTVLRDGRSVAIKKLTVSSLIKSQEDFEREVKGLGKIRHHNLVTLEGYYWTPSLQLLIYEYIPCGSLYKNLHDGPDQSGLSWRQRFNIILGMAKGLAHLHQMNLIHYNLKSTNILIDSSGEPKVGDSGLARLLPMVDRCILSSKIQSALGYMAPEFACQTVKITEKCDVYGFGVLVLEVVTGKRPVEYMEDDVVILCDMVRGELEEGRVEECLDRKLLGNYPAEEAIPVIKLGLICASQVPSNRPDMSEVVNILELIQCPSEGHED